MEFCKQDMPPPGGYKPVTYQKVPIKTLSPYLKLGVVIGITAYGWWKYKQEQVEFLYNDIEMRCAKLALIPMLQAEQDRAQLKYLKRIRDEEERIMKDVPGWEVGKYKGFPCYLTYGPNEYFLPSLEEIYKHTDQKQKNVVINAHREIY